MNHLLAAVVLFAAGAVFGSCGAQTIDDDLVLDYDTAAQLAQLPFDCYQKEYAHKFSLTYMSDDDLKSPKARLKDNPNMLLNSYNVLFLSRSTTPYFTGASIGTARSTGTGSWPPL